jgi:uncharacterized phage protein (TIGR01671 family)
MRQIKFRAFVRGFMVDVVSIDFINQYITWDDNQYDRGDPPCKCYEIEALESVELMQFTGLHDKNGKEIYEGDILKTPYNNAEVKFKDGQFGILKNNSRYGRDFTSCMSNFEIIGNIYENPELPST